MAKGDILTGAAQYFSNETKKPNAAKQKPLARTGFLIALSAAILIAIIYFFNNIFTFLNSVISSTFFIGILIGAVIGFLSWAFAKKEKRKSLAVSLIMFVVIGGLIGYFWTPALSFAGEKITFIKPLIEQITPSFSPAYYEKLASGTPTVSKEETKIGVEFVNPYFSPGKSLDVIAKISVYSPKADVTIIPTTCMLGGDSLTIVPKSQINFLKSDIEQQRTIHCTGNAKEGKLEIELQRSVRINSNQAVLPIIVAPTIEKNLGIASVNVDAPFSFLIGTYTNQPLTPGTYDFSILLKKKEQGIELADIKSIRLMTIAGDKLGFECKDFNSIDNGVEILNLDKNAIKNYAQDPNGEMYVFNCKLTVSNKVEEETLYITAEALYNIKNKYSTEIKSI